MEMFLPANISWLTTYFVNESVLTYTDIKPWAVTISAELDKCKIKLNNDQTLYCDVEAVWNKI